MTSVATIGRDDISETLATIRAESGVTLLRLVEESPVLLIFLRHFGCSFCRRAISDIAHLGGEFEARAVRPVFVHLGTPERAKPFFDYYAIGSVERISDPEGAIYRNPVFALGRVHPLWSVVTPAVWMGWIKGSIFRHGIGAIKEDGHQMPGLFFFKGPRIVRRFHYKTIADEPDYLKLIA